MDLVRAIQAIGHLKDKYSHEELLEAKEAFSKMEEAIGGLLMVCEKVDCNTDDLSQLIANYEEVKKKILRSFE